jgi:hypothetical protein
MEFRVLSLGDKDTIYQFEKNRLSSELSEIERDLEVWKSRWRPEQLEHYLNLGWCFGAWQDQGQGEELIGYFLAQPFLFLEGITQTLWIEHIGFKDETVRDALVDLAYRYGRDKHLQRVVFSQADQLQAPLSQLTTQGWGANTLEVKTTRY